MKVLYGDKSIWDVPSDMYVITAPGALNDKGGLILQRDTARQAVRRFPELPMLAGDYIRSHPLEQSIRRDELCYLYGFMYFDHPEWPIGIFQVRMHYYGQNNMGCIMESSEKLNEFLNQKPQDFVASMSQIRRGEKMVRETIYPIMEGIITANQLTVYNVSWREYNY